MTTEEMRRLRTLRRDARRDDEEEAEYRILLKLADLEAESAELRAASSLVTYGWGMIPAQLLIGATRWTTSLFPKDGGYVVPLKDTVRNAERIGVGDTVTVRLAVDV